MFDDTAPEALAVQFRTMRRMGTAGRAAMLFSLCEDVRALTEAGVRHRHPEWDRQAVRREVFRLTLGDKLFREVYGRDRTNGEGAD